MLKNILVVKETRQGEQRVALLPYDVKQLVAEGYNVFVEKNAGLSVGYSDQDYQSVGAKIFPVDNNDPTSLPKDLLILRVKRGTREREKWELQRFSENTYMMGFLDPLEEDSIHVLEWQQAGITTFSLDQLKLEADDPKNVLSAMSKIAGKLAFEDALANYKLNTTPGIIIIGTGAASIAAAKQAIDKQYSVIMLGRSEHHRKKLNQMGIQYQVIPDTSSDQIQAEFIQSYLTKPCIIVSAARSTGGKAPVLINKQTLENMREGSIIVDLAGEGGNVESSIYDQTVITKNGITIINVSAYPKRNPKLASQLYSRGLSQLVSTFLSKNMDLDDSLLKQCYVTSVKGQNPNLFTSNHPVLKV